MTILASRPSVAWCDLALDELEEPRPQAVRRDEQAAERALPREAGQDVEEIRDVCAELGSELESRPRSVYRRAVFGL